MLLTQASVFPPPLHQHNPPARLAALEARVEARQALAAFVAQAVPGVVASGTSSGGLRRAPEADGRFNQLRCERQPCSGLHWLANSSSMRFVGASNSTTVLGKLSTHFWPRKYFSA